MLSSKLDENFTPTHFFLKGNKISFNQIVTSCPLTLFDCTTKLLHQPLSLGNKISSVEEFLSNLISFKCHNPNFTNSKHIR